MLTLAQRVEAVVAEGWKLLPAVKYEAWITGIATEDLGAKHGNYSLDDGMITLSTHLFMGANAHELMYIDRHGNTPPVDEPYLSRAMHTLVHEIFHAIGHSTGLDATDEWLVLSGWEETLEEAEGYGRYNERRPGWTPQGLSSWRYDRSAWMPREYSTKSPAECFSDCGVYYAVGWQHLAPHGNGQAKMKYMARRVWGQTEAARVRAVSAGWAQKFQRV